MEVTLIHALLIGLWAGLCNNSFSIYLNRPIVLSFGVGVILGDIPTALECGAIAELAFMGFGVQPGGTVPPSPFGPGIFGTLMAITIAGVTPENALALSMPFAIAFQFMKTATYTLLSGTPEIELKALHERKIGKFLLFSNSSVALLMIEGFAIGFIGAISMSTVSAFVDMIPAWLMSGLTVAGHMLPAIGFAMILSVMLNKKLVPYAIVGYVAAAYLKLPVMGIALIGLVFALKYYFDESNKAEAVAVAGAAGDAGVEHEDWI